MQNYNNILDTIDITTGSGGAEPVTLQVMKNYLKLQGFIDNNDSTSVDDFEDDDDLIEEMITAARQYLEQALGISIISHTWKAVGATNQAGYLQLRFGPVTEVTSIINCEGDAVEYEDDTERAGDYLITPNLTGMQIEYEAGFETVPKSIISEIKRIVAYMYSHRGDEAGLDQYVITPMAKQYNRKPWLE